MRMRMRMMIMMIDGEDDDYDGEVNIYNIYSTNLQKPHM